MVETYLAPSKIQGIGLFASELIIKGQKVWEFTNGFDAKFSIESIENLSPPSKKRFLNYCYLSSDNNYILCFDDARFMNHSNKPNLLDDNFEEGLVIAECDIYPGVELTTHYRKFDVDFSKRKIPE